MRLFRKFRKKLVIVAVFCGILLANIPVDTVYASDTMTYGSWVQDTTQYDSVYGTSDASTSGDVGNRNNDDETVGFVEFCFASLIEGLGWSLDYVLNGDENFKADIDTIVRGRLKSGTTVNWFSFELVDNNPFGIIGANVYKISRSAFFPLMIIVFAIIAIGWLIDSNKVKGLLDIKQGIMWTVLMVLWMYIFPLITDFFLYAKDAFMMLLGKGLLDGEVLDLISIFHDNLNRDYTIISAVLYDGAVAGGLFYVGNYIGTATTQTILFGIMPLVSTLSIKFRKLFSNVVATFIPNLLIPAVDFSFLLMPLLYGKLVNNYLGVYATPMIAQLVQLLMVWGIIPARQAVFRAFGVMIGAGNAGGGFGGMLGTMAMMARSMGMSGRRSPSTGGNHGNKPSSVEDRNSAKYHEQLNDTLKNDARYPKDANEANKVAHERLEQMTSAPEKNNLDIEDTHIENDLGENTELGSNSKGLDNDFETPLASEHNNLPNDTDIANSIQSEPLHMQEKTESGSVENVEAPLPKREENLSSLQNAQADFDSASAAYQKENASLNDARSQLQQNEREIQNINREASKTPDGYLPINGKYDYTPEQKARVEQLQEDNKALNDNITFHQNSMNSAHTKMSDASRRLHESQRIEKSYADFDRVSGGTGKAYTNVGDFQLDNSLREAQKRFINHRNFDSKQFDGILSNEEKAIYYKQRARVTDAQTAVAFTGELASIGVGAAAAVVSTYGGANSMIQSAMLGYTASGYVTDKAVQGVNTVIENYGPNVSSAVNTGARNLTTNVENSVNTGPVKNYLESSKNASYYKGQVLANEKEVALKAQEEAIRRGGKKTNGS